jgi:hypothetical protein
METADRIASRGSAVTTPRSRHGEPAGARGCSSVRGTGSPRSTSNAGPVVSEPALSPGAPDVSSAWAWSMRCSKRTRTVTPCRAASASTHARRSWSRRRPRTVDLDVATSVNTSGGAYPRWCYCPAERGVNRLGVPTWVCPSTKTGGGRAARPPCASALRRAPPTPRRAPGPRPWTAFTSRPEPSTSRSAAPGPPAARLPCAGAETGRPSSPRPRGRGGNGVSSRRRRRPPVADPPNGP